MGTTCLVRGNDLPMSWERVDPTRGNELPKSWKRVAEVVGTIEGRSSEPQSHKVYKEHEEFEVFVNFVPLLLKLQGDAELGEGEHDEGAGAETRVRECEGRGVEGDAAEVDEVYVDCPGPVFDGADASKLVLNEVH